MAGINGMRGCYLSTDYEDRFLFVAGWHDGKITALRLKEDGSVGEITDEISIVDWAVLQSEISVPTSAV